MLFHELNERIPTDTILIVLSRITIIPDKGALANIKFSNLLVLVPLIRIRQGKGYSSVTPFSLMLQLMLHFRFSFFPRLISQRPATLGAEKKSGVPYILMSTIGIAKRPLKNMMRRHATCDLHT